VPKRTAGGRLKKSRFAFGLARWKTRRFKGVSENWRSKMVVFVQKSPVWSRIWGGAVLRRLKLAVRAVDCGARSAKVFIDTCLQQFRALSLFIATEFLLRPN